MSCPEGAKVQNEKAIKDDNILYKEKIEKAPTEGTGGLELNSFKNIKTWRKSLSNFFRHSLRSTRSNDGDRPSSSKVSFDDKVITPEQKWQSLGKIFRRQSIAEHWTKSTNQQGECSSQNKRIAVKKVISSYFGKGQKSLSVTDEN